MVSGGADEFATSVRRTAGALAQTVVNAPATTLALMEGAATLAEMIPRMQRILIRTERTLDHLDATLARADAVTANAETAFSRLNAAGAQGSELITGVTRGAFSVPGAVIGAGEDLVRAAARRGGGVVKPDGPEVPAVPAPPDAAGEPEPASVFVPVGALIEAVTPDLSDIRHALDDIRRLAVGGLSTAAGAGAAAPARASRPVSAAAPAEAPRKRSSGRGSAAATGKSAAEQGSEPAAARPSRSPARGRTAATADPVTAGTPASSTSSRRRAANAAAEQAGTGGSAAAAGSGRRRTTESADVPPRPSVRRPRPADASDGQAEPG